MDGEPGLTHAMAFVERVEETRGQVEGVHVTRPCGDTRREATEVDRPGRRTPLAPGSRGSVAVAEG